MKSFFKKLLLILLCITLIFIIYIGYMRTNYSLKYISTLLENVDFTNNIHINKEIKNTDGNTDYNMYIKNNIIKISQKTKYFDNKNENIDFDEYITKNSIITINHNSKLISKNKFEYSDLKDYLNSWPFNGNSYFQHLTNKDNIDFKYLGKSNIDGKNCLKFSITHSDYYYVFYMEINSNLIIKIEEHLKKDHSLFSTTNYTYNLNYKKEIENFNPDNFKDYQTIPIENNN